MNQKYFKGNKKIIKKDLITRLAYSRDASLYRLVPEFVAKPRDDNDVKDLLRYARNTKTPVTFRSGGTSLSGQTVSSGIIAETLHNWNNAKILNNGHAIKMQPGVNGAFANKLLGSYSRRIGPDPASINSACIGGIVSNNSSGMLCGTEFNTYHTLKDLSFILPNGNQYSTSKKEENNKFINTDPTIAEGLIKIRNKIIEKKSLVNKIRNKYRIKNTIGYSMNSFIDYKEPLDIFAHLLVGSEGTLAFISDVTLDTVPNYSHKATGLILFNSPEMAAKSVKDFKGLGASAIEFLDDQSLRTAIHYEKSPYDPLSISDDNTGLLIEFQDESEDEIARAIKESQGLTNKNDSILSFQLVNDSKNREIIWNIRKGLYPTIGSLRKAGTSVITEDIAIDSDSLAPAIRELKNIFSNCNFQDGVIYGHAKDGNIHFQTSIDLDEQDGIDNFEKMMKELSTMTLNRFDGSLKAEHGTGRNMASFVEKEWGGEIYELMWKIKSLVDPLNIMNPDVLLSKDKRLHMKNLKPMPKVSNLVDSCVECGFCEKVCPSRGYTLTPRQRIAVMRESKYMEFSKNDIKQMNHYVSDTCATDGLCSIECPVNIDTGSMVKSLRSQGDNDPWLIDLSSNYFDVVLFLVRTGIRAALLLEKILGKTSFRNSTIYLNKITSGFLPIWPTQGFQLSKSIPTNINENPEYIHVSSCVNRVLAGDSNGKSSTEILANISKLADIKTSNPTLLNKHCCGMAYSSRGYIKTGEKLRDDLIKIILNEAKGNKIPVVVDMSPCTQYLKEDSRLKEIEVLDSVSYLNLIKDNLEFKNIEKPVYAHKVCSAQKMNTSRDLIDLLGLFCSNIETPVNDFCCGTGGDRGFRFPELTKNAVNLSGLDNLSSNGVSTSRTCEVGLSDQLKMTFESIEALVYKAIKR